MDAALAAIVGADGIVADDAKQPFLTEWRDRLHGAARAIVMPRTTAEVAAVLRYCAERDFAVVPQGGNTGLCGGAIATDAERDIVVSLQRMNRVVASNASDNTLIVEAGCTLADAQAAAAAVDRYFPLSLAAEGSATIGGNIATNAGGIHVLKYGTTRDLVLGLEVVLADGQIWDGLRTVRKNTAGYDLKQLFIGSEGTLGIVTQAALKLFPRPQRYVTAFAAVADMEAAVALLHATNAAAPGMVEAFELISAQALQFVTRHIDGTRQPISSAAPFFVLVELGGGERFPLQELTEATFSEALEGGIVDDVVVASSLSQRDALWRLRHSISQAQKPEGSSLKHDVSVPVSALAAFHHDTEAMLADLCPGIRPVVFGHVGDGNLHYNLSRPERGSDAEFLKLADALSDCVYDHVERYNGSIAAEHGIGVFKQSLLQDRIADVEYGLMETLKHSLDAAGRLNTGRIVASRSPTQAVPTDHRSGSKQNSP
ncbi:MAG: FAD-binding oxidoreductase [Pseudomonadota bacterium]